MCDYILQAMKAFFLQVLLGLRVGKALEPSVQISGFDYIPGNLWSRWCPRSWAGTISLPAFFINSFILISESLKLAADKGIFLEYSILETVKCDLPRHEVQRTSSDGMEV